MAFTVFVDDNFHFADESERYTLGSFNTHAEAVNAARSIVDSFLESNYQDGMTWDQLYKTYKMYGDDPYIQSDFAASEGEAFEAWDHAREQCHALCSGRSSRLPSEVP